MLIVSYYTGIQLHDTCGSVITTQKHLFQVISATREDVPLRLRSINLGPPLLGKKKQVFVQVEKVYVVINLMSSTVDRHKFNHSATNLITFVAFSRPLYCI